MLKSSPPDRLVDAIHVVAGGEALLAPSLTQRLIAEHVRRPPPHTGTPQELQELTEREREVLTLVARGLANDEIAAALFVSLATVKTHVNRILMKLDLRSRAQAVVRAYETGLVRPCAPSKPARIGRSATGGSPRQPFRSAGRVLLCRDRFFNPFQSLF